MRLQAPPTHLWIDSQCTDVRVHMALTSLERMRGLLFHPPLAADEAILIRPCNSVHMFGMRYAIDVVFLDASNTVTKLISHLKPWRLAANLGAKSVLELPCNGIEQFQIHSRSTLSFQTPDGPH